MVSLTNLVCLFFLLTTSLSSLQTHARDSHFFSKVSRTRDDETNTIPNNNYYNNGHDDEVTPSVKQEEEKEEQPAFVPQTTHTGYGLYGHETGIDAPSTTATTASPSTLYNKYESQNNLDDNDKFVNSQVEKKYVPELTGLSGTSYTDNVVRPTKNVAQYNYNDKINQNNNNFNHNHNNYELENQKNYAQELTGLRDASYGNNVAQNNINPKYNTENEYIGNDREEKSYSPELTWLDETTSNSYNYNNLKNEYIENDQEEKSYAPELTSLGQTWSNTNNLGPNKYLSQNNYNNNHRNHQHSGEYTRNDREEKSYMPESAWLDETWFHPTNNVGPNKYVHQNDEDEKHGMSDTRYMENGKYFYDMSFDDSYNNNNNNNNKYYNYKGNDVRKVYKNQFPKQVQDFEFDDQP